MKMTRYLITFGLILIVNWTSTSQVTGLKRETKIDIVSDLQSYGLTLDKLDLTNELLLSCKKINEIQEQQLLVKDKQINNLKGQISGLEQQKKLFKKQLTAEKMKASKIGGLGIVAILIISLTKL